jgi:hypothetical protein
LLIVDKSDLTTKLAHVNQGSFRRGASGAKMVANAGHCFMETGELAMHRRNSSGTEPMTLAVARSNSTTSGLTQKIFGPAIAGEELGKIGENDGEGRETEFDFQKVG